MSVEDSKQATTRRGFFGHFRLTAHHSLLKIAFGLSGILGEDAPFIRKSLIYLTKSKICDCQ